MCYIQVYLLYMGTNESMYYRSTVLFVYISEEEHMKNIPWNGSTIVCCSMSEKNEFIKQFIYTKHNAKKCSSECS